MLRRAGFMAPRSMLPQEPAKLGSRVVRDATMRACALPQSVGCVPHCAMLHHTQPVSTDDIVARRFIQGEKRRAQRR
jgi:hypothetical protein